MSEERYMNWKVVAKETIRRISESGGNKEELAMLWWLQDETEHSGAMSRTANELGAIVGRLLSPYDGVCKHLVDSFASANQEVTVSKELLEALRKEGMDKISHNGYEFNFVVK